MSVPYRLSRNLKQSTLSLERATVESLAQLIREGSEAGPDPVVMEIQTGGDGSSAGLFCFSMLRKFSVGTPSRQRIGQLHRSTFEFKIFEAFIWPEMLLPQAPATAIAQFGFNHSAHLPGSGLELRFEHFIDLRIDAECHSFPLSCEAGIINPKESRKILTHEGISRFLSSRRRHNFLLDGSIINGLTRTDGAISMRHPVRTQRTIFGVDRRVSCRSPGWER